MTFPLSRRRTDSLLSNCCSKGTGFYPIVWFIWWMFICILTNWHQWHLLYLRYIVFVFFSCSRLRHVQSLLWEGEASPDGILCSLGIDSRYNEGCSELANYLFYGLYRKNQLNLEHILEDFPEEVLDDVIVLIKAESVHLYCNPINYSYLLPYVSHWRNLSIHCMNQTEYEDEEAAEEFKISSFVSMVQDCSRIGVPYSTQGHIQTFDMFMIEKWPIIQAFALEGIGGGSFFTMKYKLMDISEKLWQTYTRLDPVSLDNLLTEDLVLFEKQWSSFFSSFDIESHLSILELSEAQAGEAFRSYFSHGLISSNIADSSRRRQPLVLFGSHSSMENLHSYSFNFPSDGHQVRNTGPQGTPAKHMVLQCVAPKGSLACSRTYFFGTTHIPYLGKHTAVQSVLAGIKCYSNTTSATKVIVISPTSYSLKRPCQCTTSQTSSGVRGQGLRVILYSGGCVSQASMSVYDIPDLQWGKGDLGSVVFSESFLVSSINIQQKDGSVSSDSCYTILTTALPRYVCWLVCYPLSSSLLSSHLSSPQSSLLSSLLPSILSPFLSSLSIHPGIKSLSTKCVVAALFVQYEAALLSHLPFPLHSDDHCLVFSLQPRSQSHRAFYSQVSQSKNLLLTGQSVTEPSTNMSVTEPSTHRFLQHFALSSVGQEPIQDDHLGALFSTPDTRNPLCFPCVCRWVVYRPGPDCSDCFSTSHLQRYLSCFLETQRAHGGKPRLLLLTPGCTDILDVVQAVLSHPDAVVQACFTIGAVTACVDPLSSYMEHRFVFPKLVEQCSQGIVSTVVFTGLAAEQKNPLLQTVQQLIRSANPNAVFILAERGAVTRNEDVKMILSESSFSEAQMMRARYLLYPGWIYIVYSTMLNHVYFLPLNILPVSLCPLAFKSALRPNPFRGNVYNVSGKVLFSDSERMMEVSYNTVSGNLRITQQPLGDSHQGDQEPSGCFLLFHGVGLTQEALKDWLRICVKQKEVRKVKKTHTSLSPQEIRTIHVKRHLDPLPPGFFYNGQQYVSFFGEKNNFHPQMDQFIAEYVEEANREIDLFNNQLEQQQHQDLFDP
uniref:Dynein axonemal assembly factor 9 n=1 Tax=Oncorhynchus mykiss TaxID=8022 RepID=A0A8K9WZ06_ONCMY